jgi:phosphopantothenoylcysteine decarboxylase/phosphopantothenate--cysteine ligase
LENVKVVSPTSGDLACGETGDGHLASQEIVLQNLYRMIHPEAQLYKGIRAIVTAGGTQDPIDPVRVITNRSSGKMGLALADELYGMGAEVTLITTNHELVRPYPIVPVERLDEMRIAIENRFSSSDLVMMAAAVSDFTVATPGKQKIKRKPDEPLTLTLSPTVDILATLGKRKKASQLLVGFAAESQHLFQNARDKLERKNLDLIIANDISRHDIGFHSDFNEVTLLFKDKEQFTIPRQPKNKVAHDILVQLHQKLMTKKTKPRLTKDSSALKSS